jgi:polar amino acid transport system substrate-binding protein
MSISRHAEWSTIRPPHYSNPLRWVLVALLVVLSACAASYTGPDTDTRQALAPTGRLRVGVYLGSPTSLIRDAATGEAKGVSYDLGKELAARLGVPFEAVEYPRVAAVVDALKVGDVDFTVTNATPARAKDVDFTAPILALELGYLAPSGSKITSAAAVDRPGIRIGVTEGSSTQSKLSGELKNAVLVTAPTVKGAIDMLAHGGIDVYATNKAILSEMSDALPGSHILDGRWGLEHMAIGIPKGRERGMAYLRKFGEDAKESGLVQRTAQRAGLRGTAPDD